MGEVPEVREARLRPEFAPLYPGLEPGVWQDAAALAEQMLTEHLLQPSPGYMLSDRAGKGAFSSSEAGTTVTGRGSPARVELTR